MNRKCVMIMLVITALFTLGTNVAMAEISHRTLKLAHVLPPDSNFDVGAVKFRELLNESTDGKIKVQIFAGDMTSDEVEATEMIQIGNLDIGWLSTGSLSAFVKDLLLLDMPFLFRDTEHANAVLMGPVGQQLLSKFEGTGIKAIAFHEDGWREITNNRKPIKTLSDLKGLKIRTMMNDMNADMYKALGALPTPIPSGEIYSSLQTGLVNGQDNGVIVANTVGYLAIQPYVCMIRHFYSSGVILVSEKLWKSLNEEERNCVTKAAIEAGEYQRNWFWKTEVALANKLQNEGKISLTYPQDKDNWIKAVQPVYKKYFKEYPHWKDLVDQINNTR